MHTAQPLLEVRLWKCSQQCLPAAGSPDNLTARGWRPGPITLGVWAGMSTMEQEKFRAYDRAPVDNHGGSVGKCIFLQVSRVWRPIRVVRARNLRIRSNSPKRYRAVWYTAHATRSRCTSMKRTQIYLSNEQWRDLSRTARIEGASVAELIRRAVDQTYRGQRLAPAAVEAWDSLAGVWSDRDDLPDTEHYMRELREDDRLERLTGKASVAGGPAAHGRPLARA